MTIENNMTPAAILKELGNKTKAYRIEQDIKQVDLANEIAVGEATVKRMEAGSEKGSITLLNFIKVLQGLGIADRLNDLIPDPTIGPIYELDHQGTAKTRASHKAKDEDDEAWSWEDEE